MKKIVLVLVVLVFATPAWADVDITAVQVGDTNEVIISWDASSETTMYVRAFGLNIQLDNDANVLEATGLSPDYYIYPGTIVIDAEGEVTYEGTIAAEYADLPSDTLVGPPDGNGVTLECASLYAPPGFGSPNAPALFGDLASIIVNKSCTLCITANVSRAGATGVVMEDPNEVVTVNYPVVCLDVNIPADCYAGQADYVQFETVGKPPCWCYPRQCLGDADGLPVGKSNYWVSVPDLTIMKNAWNKAVTDPLWTPDMACADFDHLPVGKQNYRVSVPDLIILKANWNIAGGPAGTCLPGTENP